jgi:cytochrome c
MQQLSRLLALFGTLALPLPASAQDAGHGKAVFQQCEACQSVEAGHNGVGPSLHGVFGRKVASIDDFVYSPAFRRANFTWTPELVSQFLSDPQAGQFRGNKMPFSGLPDAKARADLVAYLVEATK